MSGGGSGEVKRSRVDAGVSWSGASRASRGPGRVRLGQALLRPGDQPAARAKRRAVARRAADAQAAVASRTLSDVSPPEAIAETAGPEPVPAASAAPDLATLARALFGPLNGVELDLYGRRGELPAREGRAW